MGIFKQEVNMSIIKNTLKEIGFEEYDGDFYLWCGLRKYYFNESINKGYYVYIDLDSCFLQVQDCDNEETVLACKFNSGILNNINDFIQLIDVKIKSYVG